MKTKILMVCLGNICRSPLAEGILQSKLAEDQYLIDSAGTGNWHVGEMPDKRSIAIAHQYGIDISNQRARQFSVSDFDTFDYIYVMDTSNYKEVIKLAPTEEAKEKVKLILSEHPKHVGQEVPDPYFGGDEGFETVFQMLDEICDVIAAKLN